DSAAAVKIALAVAESNWLRLSSGMAWVDNVEFAFHQIRYDAGASSGCWSTTRWLADSPPGSQVSEYEDPKGTPSLHGACYRNCYRTQCNLLRPPATAACGIGHFSQQSQGKCNEVRRGTTRRGGFQDRCLKPLGHPSLPMKSNTYAIA